MNGTAFQPQRKCKVVILDDDAAEFIEQMIMGEWLKTVTGNNQ
jgi:hypothetical protein